MKKSCIQEYFATARERWLIKLKKQSGCSSPWTTDLAMGTYRFCNVFREDDRVTEWVRNNVRDPLRNHPNVVTAMVACRFINRIETLEQLHREGLLFRWNHHEVVRVLSQLRPVVGAAYMIKTPTGLDKATGVASVITAIAKHQAEIVDTILHHKTIELAWQKMRQYEFVGSFIAYEIVSDLRHTFLLRDAPDIMTWAAAGPGACRGLSWLQNQTTCSVRYRISALQQAVDMMRVLLKLSTSDIYWPSEWPRWEMREVEHWLCEYYKWVKVTHLGQRMKRRYKA